MTLEQRVAPSEDYKELPKAFGTINAVQATVVRHMGRVRVNKAAVAGIEEGPIHGVSYGTPVLKKNLPRESMAAANNTIDESTMEMSIREVKDIKKPTSKSCDKL